ncbi:Hypothetical protein D9617_4g004080 [Elsinoe fawcettii]|nr:Hypothetical protein D9617_4g004080 [Elsinoe fawcettii]
MPPSSSNSPLQLIAEDQEPTLLVIAIPGIGTDSPVTWSETDLHGQPSAFPGKVLGRATYFQYRHGLTLDLDSRVYKGLRTASTVLLDSLLSLLSLRQELRLCPIVIFSHSLGGLIAKDCITKILEQRNDYREIARALACLVAVAVPHSLSPDAKSWDCVQLIMGGLGRRIPSITHDEAYELSQQCARYEQVAVDLPTFTVVEGQESRIKQFRLRRTHGGHAMVSPTFLTSINPDLYSSISFFQKRWREYRPGWACR